MLTVPLLWHCQAQAATQENRHAPLHMPLAFPHNFSRNYTPTRLLPSFWPAIGAGLRPIANLGSSSVAVFSGAKTGLSGKRPRRREKVKLVFKPVNKQLQSVLQVGVAAYDNNTSPTVKAVHISIAGLVIAGALHTPEI